MLGREKHHENVELAMRSVCFALKISIATSFDYNSLSKIFGVCLKIF